jgi:hypothetical protein
MVAFCSAHNNTRDTHMCTARQSTPSLTRHLSSLTATSFHSPATSLLPHTSPKPSSRATTCQAEICVTTFTESPDCDSIRRLIQDVEPTELLLSPALHPDMSRAVREVASEQVRWLGLQLSMHSDTMTPLHSACTATQPENTNTFLVIHRSLSLNLNTRVQLSISHTAEARARDQL